MLSKNVLLAIKKEFHGTLSLGIPLVASQLIYSISPFLGVIMIARLGEATLAASVLISMLWITLSMLFFGMLNAIAVLISHQYGAKNTVAISSIMRQAVILGLLVSICTMFPIIHHSYFSAFFSTASRGHQARHRI